MNNQVIGGPREYYLITSGDKHHNSKDMIAKVALVTDDSSVSGGVSKDIKIDDVAARDIKKEIMTANESLVLSDDEISIKVESPSDWDHLQVSEEDDKAFSHPNEWCMEVEQQQQNLQVRSQDIITARQLLFQQPALNESSTGMSIHQHPTPLGTLIQVNINDIVPNALPLSKANSVPSSLSKDISGGSVCLSNISNELGNSSIPTAVEQPSNLPCSCFICGHNLSDPKERYYYLKSHKLTNSQISLVELLSDVLNQIVVTNTGTVDLCSRCSGLINETDSVYNRLNLLKQQICKLFVNNQHTKSTYQNVPNTCDLGSLGMNPVPLVYPSPELNLNDLAATRRRVRRQPKKIQLVKKMPSEFAASQPPVQVKKNRGRPRKPFGCHICKRMFCTEKLVLNHMMREHKHLEGLERVRSEADSGLGVQENGKSEISQENLQNQPEQEDSTGKSTFLVMSDPLKIEPVSNSQSTNTTKSVTNSGTGHSSKSSPSSGKQQRMGMDAAKQVLASMRPIQPKPQTVIRTAQDGSMVMLMNLPPVVDSSPKRINATPVKQGKKNPD